MSNTARNTGPAIEVGGYVLAPVRGDLLRVRVVEVLNSTVLVRTTDLRDAGSEFLVFADQCEEIRQADCGLIHRDGIVVMGDR